MKDLYVSMWISKYQVDFLQLRIAGKSNHFIHYLALQSHHLVRVDYEICEDGAYNESLFEQYDEICVDH